MNATLEAPSRGGVNTEWVGGCVSALEVVGDMLRLGRDLGLGGQWSMMTPGDESTDPQNLSACSRTALALCSASDFPFTSVTLPVRGPTCRAARLVP